MPQCELFLYTNCETFYFVFVRTVGGSSASSGANSMSILAAELDRIFVPGVGDIFKDQQKCITEKKNSDPYTLDAGPDKSELYFL